MQIIISTVNEKVDSWSNLAPLTMLRDTASKEIIVKGRDGTCIALTYPHGEPFIVMDNEETGRLGDYEVIGVIDEIILEKEK